MVDKDNFVTDIPLSAFADEINALKKRLRDYLTQEADPESRKLFHKISIAHPEEIDALTNGVAAAAVVADMRAVHDDDSACHPGTAVKRARAIMAIIMTAFNDLPFGYQRDAIAYLMHGIAMHDRRLELMEEAQDHTKH